MDFTGFSTPGNVPSRERPIVLVALVVLTLLAGSGRAWGQAATSLRGAVTDPSGGAVPGATVLLADTASKTARTATTGEQGEYQFLFLPPGTYTLTITAGGFQRYEQTGLQLLINTPATANVQLKIGQSTEPRMTLRPVCRASPTSTPFPA